MEWIWHDAHRIPAGLNVNILTSEERDVWAKARTRLVRRSARNYAALRAIERALFVVCLDDSYPATVDEVGACLSLCVCDVMGVGVGACDRGSPRERQH